MKKWLCVILTIVMILTVAGCGFADSTSNESAENKNSANESMAADVSKTEQPQSDTQTSKTLVVYFSRTGEQYGVGVIDKGNTAIVAEMIAEKTGADTFEILPVDNHYPMTYDALTEIAKQEQNDAARPEYMGDVPELSQYDTIFIGAPVWWGDWPMICYTFFENEDLSNKALYPFSTHAGSGLSGFGSKLANACSDSTVGEGIAVTGTTAQNAPDEVREAVENWLGQIGY